MKTKLATLSLSLLVTILAACTSQNPSVVSSQPPATTATGTPDRHTATSPPPTLTSTKPATLAVDDQQDSPTPEPLTVNLTQYDLSATLNYLRHHLSVEEQIAYTNQSGEPLTDLLLIVEPAR